MSAVEEWRPVVGFEGFYEVSNVGRVRSTDTFLEIPASSQCRAHLRRRRGRILKTCLTTGGYPSVYLWKRHEGRRYAVHELVLPAFSGPRPEGHYGCHHDGNPLNNTAENLYWGTPKQNADDKRRHGTHREGEDMPWAKLTEEDVRRIRRLAGAFTQQELADEYGVYQQTISKIVRGEHWRHVQ